MSFTLDNIRIMKTLVAAVGDGFGDRLSAHRDDYITKCGIIEGVLFG